MRIKFFTVPVFEAEASEQVLNHFPASHVIVKVDRELIQSPMGTVWAICVAYLVDRMVSQLGRGMRKPNLRRRPAFCSE